MIQGRVQDFKLGGGGALKKNRAERREARKFLGYFVWKNSILRKKNHIFSNFRGGTRRVRPPLESAPVIYQAMGFYIKYHTVGMNTFQTFFDVVIFFRSLNL